MDRKVLIFVAFVFFIIAVFLCQNPADAAVTADDGFNPDADNYVYSMAVQADGKTLIR